MEKLVYNRILLHGESNVRRFLQCLHQRPLPVEFAQKSVASLFLVGSIEKSSLLDILFLCNRITSIRLVLITDEFATDGSSLWSALDALPLQSFLLVMHVEFTSPICASTMFKNLSHLDIHGDHLLDMPHAGLESLEALTHLCVTLIMERADPTAITRLISNARLRLLAFRVDDPHHEVEEFLEEHEISDHRIVLLPETTTLWGELGQGDMLVWELAEDQTKLPIPQNREYFPSHVNCR